ncbi:hypothetical protein [Bacillus sp. 37MA]|uniref:hypothetical protein n=1 Tax=Bacillus sp. 37MA TaxID=1132442 RepID=UPI00037DB8FB|nr:hypothetical protein [Bacillus sp. 37MA]
MIERLHIVLGKLNMKLIVIFTVVLVCGIYASKNYSHMLPSFNNEGEEIKISKEQQVSYDQAAVVAELVEKSRLDLLREAEKMKTGKGDTTQYNMLLENVKQYEMMYAQLQSQYNCEYFDICSAEGKVVAAANPLPESELLLEQLKTKNRLKNSCYLILFSSGCFLVYLYCSLFIFF